MLQIFLMIGVGVGLSNGFRKEKKLYLALIICLKLNLYLMSGVKIDSGF